MSDKVAELMLRNLQEVFNERDAARPIAAVRSIYAKEAEFFEANVCCRGHDAISAKVGALQTSLRNDSAFTTTSEPARVLDLGRLTWRVGSAAAPCRHRDGCSALQEWSYPIAIRFVG